MLASYGNTHDIKSKIIESVQLDFIHIYKEKGHELCVSIFEAKIKKTTYEMKMTLACMHIL